jgi:PadR family transcriptional regulator, regulatory protein AphA
MSLRHALLGLLAEHPFSGYDMMKMFDTSLANAWPATQSQLYGELTKLAAAGLVEVGAEGPRGRKEYSITAAGRAELHDWLLSEGKPQAYRSDQLLRTFLLGNVSRAEGVDFLERAAASARAELGVLARLDTTVDWGQDSLSVYGKLVLEFGRRFREMQQDWAEWAAEQVRHRPDAEGPAA